MSPALLCLFNTMTTSFRRRRNCREALHFRRVLYYYLKTVWASHLADYTIRLIHALSVQNCPPTFHTIDSIVSTFFLYILEFINSYILASILIAHGSPESYLLISYKQG